jgi:hypothetical protein
MITSIPMSLQQWNGYTKVTTIAKKDVQVLQCFPCVIPSILVIDQSWRCLLYLFLPSLEPLLSVNLETRFLLKGEDHNTLCYEVLKPFIKVLIKDYQVVNTLLGKPSQSSNDFNFDLDVNPRILFYEPKPLGWKFIGKIDVIKVLHAKFHQILMFPSL